MQLAAEQEEDQAKVEKTEDLVEVLENHLIVEVLETHLLKLHLPQEQDKVILEDQEDIHPLETQELVAVEAAVSAALDLLHLVIMAAELEELAVVLGQETLQQELEAAVDPEQLAVLVDLKTTVELVDLAEAEPEQDMLIYLHHQAQTDQELLTQVAAVAAVEDLLALVHLTPISGEEMVVQELSLYLLQTVLQGTIE